MDKARTEVSLAIEAILDGFKGDPSWYRNYMYRNSPRILADAEFITKWVGPETAVLDIGAVPPLLAEILRRRGYRNLTVADPQPENFESYFMGNGVRALSLNVLEGAPEALHQGFGLVCLNEVVEHLAGNLLSAVQSAVKCIRPGGFLMVTTPNLRSFYGIYSLVRKQSGLASKPGESIRQQYDRASAEFGYYGHVREYTTREVVGLMRSLDLKLYASSFQGKYATDEKRISLIRTLEYFFPKWRLFGKYLFQKR